MGSFVEEMKQFFDCITKDLDTPVAGIDGLNSVLIGLAAKKSLAEGRPVKISEIG